MCSKPEVIVIDTIAGSDLKLDLDTLQVQLDLPYERNWRPGEQAPINRIPIKVKEHPGRNDRCFCGSGLKYKRCCGQISKR